MKRTMNSKYIGKYKSLYIFLFLISLKDKILKNTYNTIVYLIIYIGRIYTFNNIKEDGINGVILQQNFSILLEFGDINTNQIVDSSDAYCDLNSNQ